MVAGLVDCRVKLVTVLLNEVGFLVLFSVTGPQETNITVLELQDDTVIVARFAFKIRLRRAEHVDINAFKENRIIHTSLIQRNIVLFDDIEVLFVGVVLAAMPGS